MSEKRIIIAIDGHSSCGKSTLAKSLAQTLGYTFIDSGAMYRAVTLYVLRNQLHEEGVPIVSCLLGSLGQIAITFRFDAETGKNTTFLNGENVEEEIRGMEVSQLVSPVSAIPELRKEMVRLQRELGRKKGIVMDGRDIGTVVFPNAELKIFMTASPEIRAERRFAELTAKGLSVSFEEILHNTRERDRLDQSREASPLKQADDALILDNSHLNREQQLDWVLQKANAIIDQL